jgi:hypothetical protein
MFILIPLLALKVAMLVALGTDSSVAGGIVLVEWACGSLISLLLAKRQPTRFPAQD